MYSASTRFSWSSLWMVKRMPHCQERIRNFRHHIDRDQTLTSGGSRCRAIAGGAPIGPTQADGSLGLG
jgi:hypothetical protein